MALNDDQRATLELLLEAGQSYDDIASALGGDPDEIRARAREALAALGTEELQVSRQTVDLLLGQLAADSALAAMEGLRDDPAELVEARRLAALLRLAVPGGSVPELPRPGSPPPNASATPPVSPAPPAREPSIEPTADVGDPVATPWPEDRPSVVELDDSDGVATPPASLDRGQKQLLAVLLGSAFVVVAIVLGVSGVFGSDEQTAASGDEQTAAESLPGQDQVGEELGEAPDQGEVTQATLRPVGDSEGRGDAIFGTFDGEQPALITVAEGLEPTNNGEEYHLWLLRDTENALRLASSEVGPDGILEARVDIPMQVFGFVVGGELTHIDISRAPANVVQQEVNRSAEEGRLQAHIGRSILRGPITGPGLGPEGA